MLSDSLRQPALEPNKAFIHGNLCMTSKSCREQDSHEMNDINVLFHRLSEKLLHPTYLLEAQICQVQATPPITKEYNRQAFHESQIEVAQHIKEIQNSTCLWLFNRKL